MSVTIIAVTPLMILLMVSAAIAMLCELTGVHAPLARWLGRH